MPSDPQITPELVAKHGLTPDEYQRVLGILGREPNFTELGIFSVMWSEHCSYKNSKPELKKFPTTGEGVLVKAGEENAGIIDIGDGWAICFKMESHNHPSAVEPFQGAATGVGGIIRDIFTMGARPIFSLNSLRFGDIRGDSEAAKTNRRLLAGVVSGISHYGNCIGIPTVGGEVQFDDSYNGNPLVNVFCLGVLRHDQIRKGHASGTGNPVFYVGARTGRDGLAGAAFASRDLTEESKEDRPAVQVGDPFMEKLLLEACLELFQHPEAVVGVQDMGAAGLTCSTCETASRGGTGVEIDLAKVPQREKGMIPYETMLSESQERMLIIVRKGQEKVVHDIFEKWDLPCAEIGEVTDDGFMRVKDHGKTVAEIPARQLADDAPIYHREAREPQQQAELQHFDLGWIREPFDLHGAVLKVLSHPSIASKRWVYRQYDHSVRTGTVFGPGSDAAVIRVKTGETWKYLAASVDCNGRYCLLDPYRGGKIAVAECVRNLAMTGAVPIASTDNLNFGNPHNPEIFWQLQQSVNGLAEACRFFNAPIVGGNVSLYNQSPVGPIDPTPTMGVVGIIKDEKHITPMAFQNEGDAILLLGDWGWEVAGTTYLQEVHAMKRGRAPELDFDRELLLHNQVRALIYDGLVRSAHDISDGGLITTLVECCVAGAKPLGCVVDIAAHQRLDVTLFNESQSRAVITVPDTQAASVLERLWQTGISAIYLGRVGGQTLSLQNGERKLEWTLDALQEAWGASLEKVMQ
jgi:phosphoribosylformylglycinamidine synthase